MGGLSSGLSIGLVLISSVSNSDGSLYRVILISGGLYNEWTLYRVVSTSSCLNGGF